MGRINVQISLDEEEYSAVQRQAERLGVSPSEAIRCQLRELFDETAPGTEGNDDADPFFEMIGLLEDETLTDLSTRHDSYLYGAELR